MRTYMLDANVAAMDGFVYRDMVGQRGAALIVGLIMLLLLTLVGVAGMKDTMLQERMVGSTRDREVAQQAAEAALRDAEKTIAAAGSPSAVSGAVVVANVGGLNRKIGGQNVTEQKYWLSDATWAAYGGNALTYTGIKRADGTTSVPVKYVIERLPSTYNPIPNTQNTIPTDTSLDLITDYRITARAEGLSSNSVVILQSVYRRVN